MISREVENGPVRGVNSVSEIPFQRREPLKKFNPKPFSKLKFYLKSKYKTRVPYSRNARFAISFYAVRIRGSVDAPRRADKPIDVEVVDLFAVLLSVSDRLRALLEVLVAFLLVDFHVGDGREIFLFAAALFG